MREPALELRGLTKHFGASVTVGPIDLIVHHPAGEGNRSIRVGHHLHDARVMENLTDTLIHAVDKIVGGSTGFGCDAVGFIREMPALAVCGIP